MPLKQPIEVAGPSHRHVPALDGVRGLAVLLVLVFHLMLFNDHNGHGWMDALSEIRGLGWIGVDLFFVLSGFLITGILYDTVHDRRYFRSFYMRRFLRIFPLYYGFLFLLLALTPLLHVQWGGRQFVLLGYLQNTGIWFPVNGFHPANLVDLQHFWSLAVEEQFYLFWPLLVFLIKDRRRLIGASILLSIAAFLLRIGLYVHNPLTLPLGFLHCWTLCRMDTLMIGGCLALLLRGEPIPARRNRAYRKFALAWLCAACLVLLAIAIFHPATESNFIPFIATFGYSMIAIAFAALIFLVLDPASIWARVFQMRWLRSFGKYSYGIYVLHILVGSLVSIAFTKMLGTSLRIFLTPRLHSRPLAIIVEFCILVAAVYGAAYLSYNLYEVHFLRLKRYFGYRKERAVTAPAEHAVAD